MYKIFLSSNSDKDSETLNKKEAKNILDKIKGLTFPFPKNFDIKKLKNERDFFRLRVGKVRAIFQINHANKEIIIRKIGYRKDVYKFLIS